MSDILVFITATIHCGSTPHVKRQDPNDRRLDYLTAFRHWMNQQCDADFLFCENSSADLSAFVEVAETHGQGKSVRFVSFSGNQGAQEYGKGYGEIEMLRYAFATIPETLTYRYIIKVTGRYQVDNGSQIVTLISQQHADLICDIHANLSWGDTGVVAFTPLTALNHLIPYQNHLDETRGVIIEHVMAQCLHRTLLAKGTWVPLPCSPLCRGFSGSWNTAKTSSITYRIKQDIKRRIAKWIYLY